MTAKESGAVMSDTRPFLQVKNVWQEYGDQIVLERLNLNITEGEF